MATASEPSLRHPVRVAVLGAGIFATDAYMPVLKEIPSILLPRYIWSRSQGAAEKLAAKVREWASDVEAVWGEQGLAAVEGDVTVPCCAVVLPIQHQPAMVKRMLTAGKHVLQEKPLAVSEEVARDLLTWYESMPAGADVTEGQRAPFWGVAENFRLEPVFAQAEAAVASLGRLLTCQVVIEVSMAPNNKYFNSQWRRDPSLQGAFLADCGVHYVAGLRELVGRQVSSVCCHTSHMNSDLPPPDNLTASFILEASQDQPCCSGTLQVSFCAPLNKMLWRAVCEGGVVEVTRGHREGKFGYLCTVAKVGGVAPHTQFCNFGGIDAEMRAFACEVASRQEGGHVVEKELLVQRRMISPVEAMKDLVVIAACLKSGENGGESTPVAKV